MKIIGALQIGYLLCNLYLKCKNDWSVKKYSILLLYSYRYISEFVIFKINKKNNIYIIILLSIVIDKNIF